MRLNFYINTLSLASSRALFKKLYTSTRDLWYYVTRGVGHEENKKATMSSDDTDEQLFPIDIHYYKLIGW